MSALEQEKQEVLSVIEEWRLSMATCDVEKAMSLWDSILATRLHGH